MAKTKQKTAVGWHCALWRKGKIILSHEETTVEIGQQLVIKPKRIKLCAWGYHASRRLHSALKYCAFLRGPVIYYKETMALCRVRLSGRILYATDKMVATERRILAALPINKIPKMSYSPIFGNLQYPFRMPHLEFEREVREYIMEHGR